MLRLIQTLDYRTSAGQNGSDFRIGDSLLEAMTKGQFYASAGVYIEDYHLDEDGLSLTIKESGMTKYRTRFIGKNGKIFTEDIANPETYLFRGNEVYIRSKIVGSNGKIAWTQLVMIKNRNGFLLKDIETDIVRVRTQLGRG